MSTFTYKYKMIFNIKNNKIDKFMSFESLDEEYVISKFKREST